MPLDGWRAAADLDLVPRAIQVLNRLAGFLHSLSVIEAAEDSSTSSRARVLELGVYFNACGLARV